MSKKRPSLAGLEEASIWETCSRAFDKENGWTLRINSGPWRTVNKEVGVSVLQWHRIKCDQQPCELGRGPWGSQKEYKPGDTLNVVLWDPKAEEPANLYLNLWCTETVRECVLF